MVGVMASEGVMAGVMASEGSWRGSWRRRVMAGAMASDGVIAGAPQALRQIVAAVARVRDVMSFLMTPSLVLRR